MVRSLATNGVYGGLAGVLFAGLVFRGPGARLACFAAHTGAGLGCGYTEAQQLFQTPEEFLPKGLVTASSTAGTWDYGVVNTLKKATMGAVAGGSALGVLGRSTRGATVGMALGAGVGAGMAASELLVALDVPASAAAAALVSGASDDEKRQEQQILAVLAKPE
eukprot:COSAG01_NODE_735_length_13969_cov_357.018241_16_plen_164_part_00